MQTRTCTKCGETKPATQEFFYHYRGAPDHCCSQCKECRRQQARDHYWANPSLRRQAARDSRARRADDLRAYERERSILQADRRRKCQRECRQRNLEKYRRRDQTKKARRYAAGREILDGWYASGCVVCAQYIPGAMHAHHREPVEKEQCVSQLCGSHQRLRDELLKCDPFCGNHHGMLERRLRNGDRNRPYAEVLAEMRAEWAAYVRQLVA